MPPLLRLPSSAPLFALSMIAATGAAGGGDAEELRPPELRAFAETIGVSTEMPPQFDGVALETADDAAAYVELLRALPLADDEEANAALDIALELFDAFSTSEAFEVIFDDGLPELLRISSRLRERHYDDGADADADRIMRTLNLCAEIPSQDSTIAVVEAAREGLLSDHPGWGVVLDAFDAEHPIGGRVLTLLGDPLPPGAIAFHLLEAANDYALKNALSEQPKRFDHPFDSPEGRELLKTLLTDDSDETAGLSISAVMALPFLTADTEPLFAIGYDHPDPYTRMETAWAGGFVGQERGLKLLEEFAADVRYSETAVDYLEEIGAEDRIPAVAREPEFAARAEFADWLAYPTELGEPPDRLTVLDTRTLFWPPTQRNERLFLVRFELDAANEGWELTEGAGVVGPQTFCLFGYQLHRRPPEDAYAIQCVFELEWSERFVRIGVPREEDAPLPEALQPDLSRWRGPEMTEVRPLVAGLVRMQPGEADGPWTQLVSANVDGVPGFAAIDGEESQFYPADTLPSDAPPVSHLMMHVGRRLLGFREPPDRQARLRQTDPTKATVPEL